MTNCDSTKSRADATFSSARTWDWQRRGSLLFISSSHPSPIYWSCWTALGGLFTTILLYSQNRSSYTDWWRTKLLSERRCCKGVIVLVNGWRFISEGLCLSGEQSCPSIKRSPAPLVSNVNVSIGKTLKPTLLPLLWLRCLNARDWWTGKNASARSLLGLVFWFSIHTFWSWKNGFFFFGMSNIRNEPVLSVVPKLGSRVL